MNSLVSYGFVAIILGWIGFALTGLFAPFWLALIAGAVLGPLSVTLLRHTLAIKGFIALMGPIGVVLPLLALRHVGFGLGMELQVFSSAELVIFILAYTAFLATSIGVLSVDVYRLGYVPLPVGIMVLALCIYGGLTGNLLIPLVAVIGQALWVKGWVSSNWFDHVLHAALLPIALIALISRMF